MFFAILKHEEHTFLLCTNHSITCSIYQEVVIMKRIPLTHDIHVGNIQQVFFIASVNNNYSCPNFSQVLEENCLQDLMFSAVHAQRTGTQSMASRLRKVSMPYM